MVLTSNIAQKDYSISFVRLVAMLLIVLCHIFQFYAAEIAQWLNVGVQIFFFMSGYLYGHRKYDKNVRFILKNIKKVLINYYVFLFIYTCIHYVCYRTFLQPIEIVNLIFCRGTAEGIEHLWFVQIILICYLITPFIANATDKIVVRFDDKKWINLIFVLLLNIVLAIALYLDNAIWVTCYFIGFFLRRNFSLNTRNVNQGIVKISLLLTIVLNTVVILNNYVRSISIGNVIVYRVLFAYGHVFLGISLFCILSYAFNKGLFDNSFVRAVADKSDIYSYDIYLVHHMWIIGPFSVLSMDISPILKYPLLIVIVLVCSWLVNKSSGFINNQINRLVGPKEASQ